MVKYIPLHAHLASGSIGDSILNVKDYVQAGVKAGLSHLAMTDHGSLSAMINFYDECKNNNITPIIGMEAYTCADNTKKDNTRYHLVLLAKNKEGVKDLIRIHNNAQLEGFYCKPRTDDTQLEKYGKNLIALSACVGGEIPKLILEGKWRECVQKIIKYKKIFSQFYLELQPGSFREQIYVNAGLVQLSKMTNTPLVVTNDIHYLAAQDYSAHNLHVKNQRKSNIDEGDLDDLVYPDKCYYFMEAAELKSLMPLNEFLTEEILDEAIANTNAIAEQCDGEVEWNFKMPNFIGLPEGETEKTYITKLCLDSLNTKLNTISNPSQYIDRLQHELDTIDKLGFNGYFLSVWDIMRYAKENDIAMGPGRGSCGGSLVSWLLGITVADPIKYNLMFERFLSVHRKSLPDIDLDCASTQINKLKNYVINKYGVNNCAFVGTFGMTKAKSALKIAGRLLCIDPNIVNTITKTMRPHLYVDGEKEDNPSLQQYLESSSKLREYRDIYPDLFIKAEQVNGYPVSMGVHAAGLVISPDSLMDKVPLRKDKSGAVVSTYTKECIERCAIKYDFLSLDSVSVIMKTQRDAGITINLNDEEFFNDESVWNLIGSKYTDGIFQISSNTYKQRMPRLRPKNLSDMAACLALVRSPCIAAHTDEEYMKIVEGKAQVQSVSPEYDKVTKNTNGICIYQEEIMNLAVEYGMDLESGYKLLKLGAKKKINEMKQYRDVIFEKAKERGASQEMCDKIWSIVLDSTLYSFNSAHAFCYGIVTYESAWLKYHHPLHFMANLLTNAYSNKKDKGVIKSMLSDCRRMKIEFLPVDINQSDWDFKVEDNKIRVGFCAIKGMGDKVAAEIVNCRPYSSVSDFFSRINKTIYRKPNAIVTIFSGCFLSLDNDMKNTYAQYCEERNKGKNNRVIEMENVLMLNKTSDIKFNIDSDISYLEKMILRENFVYGNNQFSVPESDFSAVTVGNYFESDAIVTKVSKKQDKYGRTMAFLELDVADTSFRGIVFSSYYAKIGTPIKKNMLIHLRGKKNEETSSIIYDLYEREVS